MRANAVTREPALQSRCMDELYRWQVDRRTSAVCAVSSARSQSVPLWRLT
jgi:hypothetical protein